MGRWLLFLSVCLLVTASAFCEEKSLKINIISYKNGVGLNKDIEILTRELTKLGHHVESIDFREKKAHPKVDINLYVEVVANYFWAMADKNYLIPNPEWYKSYIQHPGDFDLILCKTKEAERIFKPLNRDSIFISFTSLDKYDPSIVKDYKAYMHLAGASIHKATGPVAYIWARNPHFPTLQIIKHQHWCNFPKMSNLNAVCAYLPESEIKQLQNHCGVHVCPSETEGFGHYIMEALSCGAVVLTTDGPPMNEFVSDPRCLIGSRFIGKHYLANTYFISGHKLEKTVEHLLTLSTEELEAIGKKNRQFYLNNDLFFKRRLTEIFGDASSPLKSERSKNSLD